MTYWINSATEAHIKGYETLRLTAYDDKQPKKVLKPGDTIVGTLTIGWGHIDGVSIGDTITKEKAQELFVSDVTEVIEALIKNLGPVWDQLNDYEKGGLVSFFFNVGIGWMTNANPQKRPATFFTKLKRGDLKAPVTGFPQFTLSKGERMEGLVNRRAAEVALYTYFDNRSAAPGGNVIGEAPARSLAVRTKEFLGTAIAGSGTAGNILLNSAQEYSWVADAVPYLKVAFGIAMTVGVGLLVVSQFQKWQKSGA